MRGKRQDSVTWHLWDWLRGTTVAGGRFVRGEVIELVGGPARARVILLFGAVLGLSSADAATVGAVAPQLEHSLHIDNAQIGLLASVGLLVGAVCVIPLGLMVDRVKRMPLLAISIVLWSLASLMGAFSHSYWHLVLWRTALGATVATAGPAIASLTGDYFPAEERGRVYAYILGGETAGTAVGFMVSGTLASIISWRAAFIALALPGFWLARALWRTVPEPQRGGQSWLKPGTITLPPYRRMPDAQRAGQPPRAGAGERAATAADEPDREEDLALKAARRRGIKPDPGLILNEDPQRMSLLRAVTYTLAIPTNLLITITSALGYFYFSGLQTYALLYVKGHYHVSQATSELGLGLLVIGALIGTLLAGRVTDVMLRHGVLKARIVFPAVCYLGAVACLIPGIVGTSLMPSLWFDIAGGALICAANPPIQAAKLDIMPARLWGRAESVRTFIRSLAQAVAPIAFGGVSVLIEGFAPRQVPIGAHAGAVSHNTTIGLEVSFLVMCVALAIAGLGLLRAGRSYPTDVVTAAESEKQAGRRGQPGREVVASSPAPDG